MRRLIARCIDRNSLCLQGNCLWRLQNFAVPLSESFLVLNEDQATQWGSIPRAVLDLVANGVVRHRFVLSLPLLQHRIRIQPCDRRLCRGIAASSIYRSPSWEENIVTNTLPGLRAYKYDSGRGQHRSADACVYRLSGCVANRHLESGFVVTAFKVIATLSYILVSYGA